MAIKAQVIDSDQPVAKVDTDTAKNAKLPYVISVNGKRGDVEITPESIGAMPKGTKIPGKTSELINDAGFVNAAGAAAAAPVQSVNGETGDVELDIPTKTSDLDNDSGFVDEAGAAEAAPVQSVNGETGDIVGLLSAYQGTETVLQAGDDLNAITTPGEYRIPDGTDVGALLLHRPDNFASSGRLIVLEGGNPVYRTQILLTTGVVPTVTYMRSGYYGSTQQAWVWWDWKASGAPLNATRVGKAIPEGADLNSDDYKILGEYYISGAAVAATVTCGEDPIPYAAGSSRLLVLRPGSGSGAIQVLLATSAANLYVYMRIYSNSQWYGWRRLLYTVDGGIPVSTTPDTSSNNTQIATTAFVKSALTDYIPAPSNPSDNGKVLTAQGGSAVWASGGGSGSGTDTEAVHTARYGTSIPSNSDLDTYKTPGEYYINTGTIAQTIAHNPYPGGNSRLFVFVGGYNSTATPYRVQVLLGSYGNAGSALFIRATKSNNTWSDWVGMGDSVDPFFAEYGVTTSAEIEAAFQAGRPVFCKRTMTGNSVLYYVLSYRYTATNHWFTCVYGPKEYQANCDSDAWTSVDRNLVKSVNGKTGDGGAVELKAADIAGIPTKTSQLENDGDGPALDRFVSQSELNVAEHSPRFDQKNRDWYGPRIGLSVGAKILGPLSAFRYAFRMPQDETKRPEVARVGDRIVYLTVEYLLRQAAITKSVYRGYSPVDTNGSHPNTGYNTPAQKAGRMWGYNSSPNNDNDTNPAWNAPEFYLDGTTVVVRGSNKGDLGGYDNRYTMCSDSVVSTLYLSGYREIYSDKATGTGWKHWRYNQFVPGEYSLPKFLYGKGWDIIQRQEDLLPGDIVFTKYYEDLGNSSVRSVRDKRFNPSHIFIYVGKVEADSGGHWTVEDWTQGTRIQLLGAPLTSQQSIPTAELAYDNGAKSSVQNYDLYHRDTGAVVYKQYVYGNAAGTTTVTRQEGEAPPAGYRLMHVHYRGGLTEAHFRSSDSDKNENKREPNMLWSPTLFGFRGGEDDPDEDDGSYEWRGVTSSCIFSSDKRYGLLGEMYCPRSLRHVDWLTYWNGSSFDTEKINYPIIKKHANKGVTTYVKYSKAGIMEAQLHGVATSSFAADNTYILFNFGASYGFSEGLRAYPEAGAHRYDAFAQVSAAGHVARLSIEETNGIAVLKLTPTSNIPTGTEIAASFTTMRPTTI